MSIQPPPLFVDVTWTLAAGKRALETLVAAKAVCGLDVQMHLSCTDLTRDMAEAVLSDAAQAGIRGLMILRGDPPADRDGEWLPIDDGFRNPGELVAFVRQRHGDQFSISVAGHPAGHPAHPAASQEAQIEYLRAKVPLRSTTHPLVAIPQPLASPSRSAWRVQRARTGASGAADGTHGAGRDAWGVRWTAARTWSSRRPSSPRTTTLASSPPAAPPVRRAALHAPRALGHAHVRDAGRAARWKGCQEGRGGGCAAQTCASMPIRSGAKQIYRGWLAGLLGGSWERGFWEGGATGWAGGGLGTEDRLAMVADDGARSVEPKA
jgi:hypothetical protein